MNMHAVNTCKQWLKYRCTCLLQVCHKRKTLECTVICAHDEEYAHGYLHGTINGTSVDRFIVDDEDILVIVCTENIE